MKKYESVELKILLLLENDMITSSGDGEPIPAGKGEGLWNDFYN